MIVGFKVQSSLMQDAEKYALVIQPDPPNIARQVMDSMAAN